jgi:cell division transport system ATP-binding protein
MIEFRQVSKRYANGFDALMGVNFAIAPREMVFITGHSGAGKSTLMKLIMLMERPTSGQVMVADQALNTLRKSQVPYLRRKIGVVFQNHQLLFDRSVYENVALPLRVCGFDERDAGRRVRAALDKVGLLDREKANPIALSGGEQQRVAIARALVHKPAILLADEPTGNLDPQLASEVMSLFQQFSDVGVTLLIASHDIALIRRMGHRVLGLEQGHLVYDGAL